MELFAALLLGVIEGLTEFLPVSSTGHLVLAMPLLGVDGAHPTWKSVLWVSQMGGILAVIVYFWRDLWQRVLRPRRLGIFNHILTKLAAAMLPTVVLGLLLNEWFEAHLENPPSVAVALLIGAGIMEWIDRSFRRTAPQTLDDISLRQAFLIGLIQCVSMWPGISRAGATIMAGMALGLTPRVATEFSFYLAIPTLLAAGVKTLLDQHQYLTPERAAVVLIASATAFVTALLVVGPFLEFVQRRRFRPFVIYRVALGTAVLAYWTLAR